MIRNGKTTFIFHRKGLVDNLLKKSRPNARTALLRFAIYDLRFTIFANRKP